MKTTPLLLAAAAAAIAVASPAFARPMTATDMHMMHRLASPSVAPDGKTAIFTISDTDLAANKRKNTLYSLDLAKAGAKPVAVAGIGEGHDAVFGADGAIWFLAPVKGQDQLFRMKMGGKAVQVSTLKGDISGFKISKDGSRLLIFADRDMRCADFACADVKAEDRGGSARAYDQLFVRHWDTWATPGTRSRLFAFPISRRQGHRQGRAGIGRAGRRHAVQAVRRRRGDRHLQRRQDRVLRAARGGADRGDVDQSRHLFGADRRLGGAAQPHRRQSGHRQCRRRCRPTAAPWRGCRWPAPAMNPTAR